MPMFLYDLPNWAMGALISVASVLLTLAGYWAFRRFIKSDFDEGEKGLALSMLAVIATINALLLAFSAVSVWEAFGAADEAVVAEANGLNQLSRDLAVFGSVESELAREELKQYAQSVIKDEWPLMRDGNDSEESQRMFDEMFRQIGRMHPDTPQREALMPEVWSKVNELLAHRRDRLYVSQSEVPAVLWAVVFWGTILTMVTTFVLPPTTFNLSMIASLGFSMGLVFYFIIAMDRPFAGEESISPAPIESALANMELWDREALEQQAPTTR